MPDMYRNPQDQRPVTRCENPKCQQEVWRYECTFHWEGLQLCPSCFREAVIALLEDDPQQVALEIGVEVTRYI